MNSDNNYSELILHLKKLGFDESQIRSAIYATGVPPILNDKNENALLDYMANTQVGRPVQLVKPNDEFGCDDGGFELNYGALEDIFGNRDVKNKPVAIYSLTGAFRKGKSFLLNLFLHRLSSNQSKKWLSEKSQVLDTEKGFHWRGGHESDTKGIWIWSKPIPVVTSDGKEVMLFLMDTQGAFDLVADVKCSSVIFALSTMIGSVQIYNVSQQIQSDDLQNLHLFANYGKTAKQEYQKQNKIRGQTPFQDLLFLVRDWPDKDVSLGRAGGSKYLKKVLNKSKNKEIVEIRENMKNYFTNLSCFLLPYPGRAVAERGSKSDKIGFTAIDNTFLKYVDELHQQLFDPANIVVKQNNGYDVTGRDLINLISSYFQIFKSGKMPEVESILEANKKAAMVTLMQKGKRQYSENMNMLCTGYTEELESFHQECKKEALSMFDQSPKLGEQKFIESRKKGLGEIIDQQLELYKEKNKTFYERLKNDLRDLVDKMAANFRSKLEKDCNGQYVEEKELLQTYERNCKKVLAEFREKANDFDEQLVKKYEDKIKKEMERLFKTYQETNSHKKYEMERKLSELAVLCKIAYNDLMNEIGNSAVDDTSFEQTHLGAYEASLAQFNSCDVGLHTELRIDYEKMLKTELGYEKSKFTNINNTNKKLEKAKSLEIMVKARDEYSKLMKSECGDTYVEESELEKAHARTTAKCLKLFGTLGINAALVRQCEQQFTGDVAPNLLEQNKQNNRNNKVNAVNRLKKLKENCYISYERDMKQFIGNDFKEATKLYEKHQEKMRDALSKYERKSKEGSFAEKGDIKCKLEGEIGRCFEDLESQNNVYETKLKEDAKSDIQEMKNTYLQQMNELTDGKYVKPTQLKQVHDQAKKNLKKQIERSFSEKGLAKMGEDFAEDLCNDLDERYKTICSNNENNKSYWITRVGKGLIQGVIQGAKGFALGPPGRLKFVTGAIGFVKGFMEGYDDE